MSWFALESVCSCVVLSPFLLSSSFFLLEFNCFKCRVTFCRTVK